MHVRISLSAAMISIAAALAILAPPSAEAQYVPPSLRLVDLGPIGLPQGGEETTMGINEAGQIAGTKWNAGPQRAFIWVPAPAFGFTGANVGTMILLETGTGVVASLATDINDQGIIVGQAYNSALSLDNAAAWTISGGVATRVNLGVLSGGGESIAFAGSNSSSSPRIVGMSERSLACEPFPVTLEVPFSILFTAPLPAMVELPPTAAQSRSAAYDVHGNSGLIVGRSELPELCEDVVTAPCLSDARAATWIPQLTSFVRALLPIPSGIQWQGTEHAARGANADGDIVGYGFEKLDPPPIGNCGSRGFYWPLEVGNPDVPFNLHTDTDIVNPEEDGTRAEAVTDRDGSGRLRIVGANIFDEIALQWLKDPTQSPVWHQQTLNNSICGPCATGWNLRRAHDINNSYRIVGEGSRDGVRHAFLLVPLATCQFTAEESALFDCWGDFNEDGEIGGPDLALLLGQYGPCSWTDYCFFDLSCSGTVGGDDLAILLGMWGPCESSLLGGGSSPQSFGEPSHPTLEELIVALIELGHPELVSVLQGSWPSGE